MLVALTPYWLRTSYILQEQKWFAVSEICPQWSLRTAKPWIFMSPKLGSTIYKFVQNNSTSKRVIFCILPEFTGIRFWIIVHSAFRNSAAWAIWQKRVCHWKFLATPVSCQIYITQLCMCMSVNKIEYTRLRYWIEHGWIQNPGFCGWSFLSSLIIRLTCYSSEHCGKGNPLVMPIW